MYIEQQTKSYYSRCCKITSLRGVPVPAAASRPSQLVNTRQTTCRGLTTYCNLRFICINWNVWTKLAESSRNQEAAQCCYIVLTGNKKRNTGHMTTKHYCDRLLNRGMTAEFTVREDMLHWQLYWATCLAYMQITQHISTQNCLVLKAPDETWNYHLKVLSCYR